MINPLPEHTESFKKHKIAIFASGAGSNAKKIIDYSLTGKEEEISGNLNRDEPSFTVDLIVCNKPGAGVLNIAANYGIESIMIEKDLFFSGDTYTNLLQQKGIDFIVLAGFLWKIPSNLIKAYPNKIINIHPALLPKFGGKGMYGTRVHEAVIAATEKESGITIHFVDDQYDHGQIIFQASCPVNENDTPDTLAGKIHALEHLHFPIVINETVKMQNRR